MAKTVTLAAAKGRRALEQLFKPQGTQEGVESGWQKPSEPKPTLESLEARANELRAELEKVEAERSALIAEKRLDALLEVRRLIQGYQFTHEELFGRLAHGTRGDSRVKVDIQPMLTGKPKKTARPDKYRKDDKGWCGIGKKPQWVLDVLAAGGNLDDYLVRDEAAQQQQ